MNNDEGKPTLMQRTGAGAQKNAPELGMAGAIIVVWLLNEFANVTAPDPVVLAIGSVIGAIVARVKG